jgi:hypothetical protein
VHNDKQRALAALAFVTKEIFGKKRIGLFQRVLASAEHILKLERYRED